MNYKFFVIFGLIILNNNVFGREIKDFDKFCAILAQLESNQNNNAIGDNGKAIGIYQIHKSYWQDAINNNKSIGGKYTDCFNPEYSKKIVNSYLSKYCKSDNFEDLARCHNSGPDWRNKKDKTEKYWQKFKKIMLAK